MQSNHSMHLFRRAWTHSSLHIGILSLCLLLLCSLSPINAQTPLPVESGNILYDLRGKGYNEVVQKAGSAATPGSTALKRGSSKIEVLRFDVSFTANADTDRLAVLSDDGCDIYIQGGTMTSTKFLSRRGMGQHLPNLGQSLWKVPFTFTGGTTYTIQVVYTNTVYSGTTDVDGVTLFAYTDYSATLPTPTPSPTAGPTPTLTPTPVPTATPTPLPEPEAGEPRAEFSGVTRAVAGGVGDAAHTISLSARFTREGQPLANTDVSFRFENNRGQAKTAKFQGPTGLVDQLTVKTDSQGNAGLSILSGDTIGEVNVLAQAPNTLNEVVLAGRTTCSFVPPVSKRRYGIKDFDQGWSRDIGWDFDQGRFLRDAGGQTTATLHLKFQRDPSIAEDRLYFLVPNPQSPGALMGVASLDTNTDGDLTATEIAAGRERGLPNPPTPQYQMRDADNWLPVSGHEVLISIESILGFDNDTRAASPLYAYFVNEQGQVIDQNGNPKAEQDPFRTNLPSYIKVVTDSQGRAVVRLKAGPEINQCRRITLRAVDNTVKR